MWRHAARVIELLSVTFVDSRGLGMSSWWHVVVVMMIGEVVCHFLL